MPKKMDLGGLHMMIRDRQNWEPILRKFEVDELPNLFNVFLGEMSLVGPRPEQAHYVEQFRKIVPQYMERHREKAGMAGWAQVNGMRGDTSIMERTKYDLGIPSIGPSARYQNIVANDLADIPPSSKREDYSILA